MRSSRRQWIAVILSGVFPGLGQFYLRAWGKGIAFFIAGGIGTWALGRLVSAEDLLAGRLTHPAATMALLLAILAIYLWSIADAWMSGGGPSA